IFLPAPRRIQRAMQQRPITWSRRSSISERNSARARGLGTELQGKTLRLLLLDDRATANGSQHSLSALLFNHGVDAPASMSAAARALPALPAGLASTPGPGALDHPASTSFD